MPNFADANDYLRTLKMGGNNSNLANILQSIGVKCSPCMQSALRAAGSRDNREKYYQALRASAEQIQKIEEALGNK